MRELSFWGWGFADQFPGETERRDLARLLAAVLGHGNGAAAAEFALRPLPALERIRLPVPRLAVPEALAVSASAAPEDRAAHTYGKSYIDLERGFGGDFTVAPDAVIWPETEAQVAAVLDWCAGQRVACIPYGGGTSVVRGVEAAVGEGYRGAVCLDLKRMNQVLEVDALSRSARIQAGATGPALEAALAGHGLTLRHYPQSFEFSTLGGWLATRAGGHFATLYTHIDDLTQAIRMITPVGTWQSVRVPASGAGPSPDRLALGSEGALGIITEAWMRVMPRPRWRASASVHFADFWAGVRAAREIGQSGLYPANCRLLDSREAMLHQVAAGGVSVLLLGFESADHPVSQSMARALEIARSAGGQCAGARESDAGEEGGEASAVSGGRPGRAGEAESWRAAFFQAPYRFNALVSIGAVVDTFETACTWDRFEELHRAVIAEVRAALREVCGQGLVTMRFTHVYPDGPAPYYTFIGPGREGARLTQWAAIKAAASEAVMRAGGTITHHHGVGRMHRPWYDRERPEPFAMALRAAKAAVDPAGVLNPGVLVDVGRSD